MMSSSPVANPVCWGSIIAIPLNLTIPFTGRAEDPIDRQMALQVGSRLGHYDVTAVIHNAGRS